VIAICDSGAGFRNDTLRILTELVPNSYWTTLCNKQQAARGGPMLDAAPPLPAYIELPEIGYIASTRSLGSELVKVFIMGNKANAGHTHEDKGSFVLEFAGRTFAADLGSVITTIRSTRCTSSASATTCSCRSEWPSVRPR
jgi:hypothetical protein